VGGVGLWCLHHFQQYFSYIVVVSFIGWRKLEYPEKITDLSQVTDMLNQYRQGFNLSEHGFTSILRRSIKTWLLNRNFSLEQKVETIKQLDT
jgi:hypothetical protein